MPEGVIDVFELVQIKIAQDKFLVLIGDKLLQDLEQPAPVRNSGQLIVLGERFKLGPNEPQIGIMNDQRREQKAYRQPYDRENPGFRMFIPLSYGRKSEKPLRVKYFQGLFHITGIFIIRIVAVRDNLSFPVVRVHSPYFKCEPLVFQLIESRSVQGLRII